MAPLRKFIDWIKLTQVTQGLSEPEARAVRTTGSIQIIMFSFPSLLTVLAVNYHMAALFMAQADDPAPLGFLITSILPFLMIGRHHPKLRWVLVIAPVLLPMLLSGSWWIGDIWPSEMDCAGGLSYAASRARYLLSDSHHLSVRKGSQQG